MEQTIEQADIGDHKVGEANLTEADISVQDRAVLERLERLGQLGKESARGLVNKRDLLLRNGVFERDLIHLGLQNALPVQVLLDNQQCLAYDGRTNVVEGGRLEDKLDRFGDLGGLGMGRDGPALQKGHLVQEQRVVQVSVQDDPLL